MLSSPGNDVVSKVLALDVAAFLCAINAFRAATTNETLAVGFRRGLSNQERGFCVPLPYGTSCGGDMMSIARTEGGESPGIFAFDSKLNTWREVPLRMTHFWGMSTFDAKRARRTYLPRAMSRCLGGGLRV